MQPPLSRDGRREASPLARAAPGGHDGPVNAPPRPVVTPCVKVCVVDGASELCLGCYRTLGEIAGWSAMDEAARAAVMAELPERRGRIDPALLGD